MGKHEREMEATKRGEEIRCKPEQKKKGRVKWPGDAGDRDKKVLISDCAIGFSTSRGGLSPFGGRRKNLRIQLKKRKGNSHPHASWKKGKASHRRKTPRKLNLKGKFTPGRVLMEEKISRLPQKKTVLACHPGGGAMSHGIKKHRPIQRGEEVDLSVRRPVGATKVSAGKAPFLRNRRVF